MPLCNVNELLEHELLSNITRSTQMTKTAQRIIPGVIQSHCRIAVDVVFCNGKQMGISASQGAQLTNLRYMQDQILALVQAQEGFSEVEVIKLVHADMVG